ncbi:broad-complex core protein isoform [Anaeramoeba flamelloides]|uniref:Broad-complex core protein isoform n=1 Tax=Anaeramoeba flamelloides TaxID=1746091 RepID=A0AAV7YZ67_9EUKA|nr:broad-complex core protein isoform [Anaeramoeba flamelloides]
MDRTTLKLESHFGTGFRFTKCCHTVDRFENLASLLTGLEFARVVLQEEDLDLDKLYSENCISFLTLTCIFCPSKYIQFKQAGVEIVQNVENLTTYQNLLKNTFSVRDKCLFEISLVNKEKSELWKLFRTLFMLKAIIEKEGSKQVINSESSSSSVSFSDNDLDDEDEDKNKKEKRKKKDVLGSFSNSNSDSDNEFNSKKKNKIQKKDIRIISSLNKELPKALQNLKKIKENVYENSFYFRKQGLLKRNEPTLREKEINEAKTKLLNKLLKIDLSKSDSTSEATDDENQFEEFLEKKFNKVALSICDSDQLEFFKNHFSPDILPLPVNWFECNENEVSEDEKSNKSNDSDDKVETSDDNDNDYNNSKSQSNSNSNDSNSKSNDDTSNSDSNKNSDNNSDSSGEKSQQSEDNSENRSQEKSENKKSTSSSSINLSDSNKKKKPTKKEKIAKLRKRIQKEKDEQREIEKKINSSLKKIKKKEKKITNTKRKIEKKKDVLSKVFLEEIHYHPKSSYLSEKSLPLLLKKIEKNITIKIQNDNNEKDTKKKNNNEGNNNEENFNRNKIKIIGQLENFFYLNYYDKWMHIDKRVVDKINISEDLKISNLIQHLLKQFEESYKSAITLSHFGYFEESIKVSYNSLNQKNTQIMDAKIRFSKKYFYIDFANEYSYSTNWGNHFKIYLDKNNLKWVYLIDTKEKKLFNIRVSNETLRRTIVFLLLTFNSTWDKLNLIGHNPKVKYYDSQSISQSTVKTTKTAIHRKLLPYLGTWANDESNGKGKKEEEEEKSKKRSKMEGKGRNKKKGARGTYKDELEQEKIEKIEKDLETLRKKIKKFDRNQQVVFGVSIQSGRTVPIESGWLKVDSSGIYIGSARTIKAKKDIIFDENFDIGDNSENCMLFNIDGISHSDHKRIQRAKQKSKSTILKKISFKKIFNPKQENLHLVANSKRERDLIIITTFFFYEKSRISDRKESGFEKIFEKLESLLIKFDFKYIPKPESSQSTQNISSDSPSSSSSSSTPPPSSEKEKSEFSSEKKSDSSSESENDWELDSDDPIHDNKKIEKYIEDSQDDKENSEKKSNQSDMNEKSDLDDEDNEKYSDKNESDDDDDDEDMSADGVDDNDVDDNDDNVENNSDNKTDDENEDEKGEKDGQRSSSRSSSPSSSKSENEDQKDSNSNSNSNSNTNSSEKSSNKDGNLSGMNINKEEFLDVINENNSSSESNDSTNSFKSSSSLSD